MFDVAIILINYNSTAYTIKCIESIFEKTDSTTLHYQIIVVDNASETESFQNLKDYIDQSTFSNIILKRSKINTGFGGGNMLGIQEVNAEYYAFINNDSIFLNDCLNIIINEMRENHSYGICGPAAFTENGKHLPTLDHFASLSRELLGRKFLELINPKEYPRRKKTFTQPQKGQFVSGSFMVVRTEDFNEVGGFDTNLFLYHEETDLCKRLRKINRYAYLIPEAQFLHYHGVSTPKSILIKTELKISLLYVINKHSGYISYKLLLTHLQFRYFISSIVKPKYWHIFKVLLKGARLSDSLKQKQKIIDKNKLSSY